MSSFLRKTILFFLLSVVVTFVLVIVTATYARSSFDYKLPNNVKILILGNSKPECSIRDTNIPNTKNMALSGSAYFYEYLKLKEFTKHNPQIETIVLGYSYGDISESLDEWFRGSEKIKFKIRNFFFLFSLEDYTALLKANPVKVIQFTPQVILHNIKMAIKGKSYLGGFQALEGSEISSTAIREVKNSERKSANTSQYQITYLKKIHDFCYNNNLNLVLLGTPLHESVVQNQQALIPEYIKLKENTLKHAILIDNSTLPLTNEHFKDFTHLNSQGANKYSNHLKNNVLNQLLSDK